MASGERTNCKSGPWGPRRDCLPGSSCADPGTTFCYFMCVYMSVYICKEVRGQFWVSSLVILHINFWDRVHTSNRCFVVVFVEFFFFFFLVEGVGDKGFSVQP